MLAEDDGKPETAQDILAAMVQLVEAMIRLPFIEQDRLRRILDHGTSRMRPEPVGRGEDPKVVVAWMLAPDTWERWSRW